MLKETNETLTGNDRFEGFCKDIIHEISEMLGFRYVFKLVDDGNYGNPNPITGEFDGMVRELLDGVITDWINQRNYFSNLKDLLVDRKPI